MQRITAASILDHHGDINNGEVHIFLLQLSLFDSDELLAYLPTVDIARAQQLKIIAKRKQFIITRGLLRLILAHYIKHSAKAIIIYYNPHHKPYINHQLHNKTVEFNISHSGDYALIALSLGHPIGIDIETVNPSIDYAALAQRYFSDAENKLITSLDSNLQLGAFYQTWTRKEAFIKAIGKGLFMSLKDFSVPVNQTETGLPITTPPTIKEPWFCYDVTDSTDYKSALTAPRKDLALVIKQCIDE